MVFKEFNDPTLTEERVKRVIDDSLDELEYSSEFSTDTAVKAVYFFLRNTPVWDSILDNFAEQLKNGLGPEDAAPEDAICAVEELAREVETRLNRIDADEYKRTIDRGEFTAIIRKVNPEMVDGRPSDMSEEDAVELLLNIFATAIVGGIPFAEDEFLNYADTVQANAANIKAVLDASQKEEA